MKKKVSVIIINWNGLSHLKLCLPSLYSQNYINIEVIIVDNASSDSSVQYIRKNYPKVKIIINSKNLGFSDANNIGYRNATGEYILFLNNDTKVTNNFLTELVKGLEKENRVGGVQSKILLMDDNSLLDAVGAFLTNTGFLYHYGIGKKDIEKYSREISLFSAKGACMMFKKSVLEEVLVDNEVLDSRYFAYFEETDLCHRVLLAGYKIIFVPQSIIFHKMGATSSKLDNSFVQFHSFKNRINSYLKNLGVINLIKILSVHIVVCEIVAIVFLFLLKPKISFAINRAILWNILNFTETLKKRNYIQKKIRKISDKKLFKVALKKVRPSYYFYLLTGIGKYEE